MKKLLQTTITKKDTCLSYALKRTGIETDIEFVDELEKEFDIIPVKETKIEIGDIVAWEKKEKKIKCATTIKESGLYVSFSQLLNSEVNTRFHIGVVEGLNCISDLTRSANPYYIPSLRMRQLVLIVEDYQAQCPYPDFVIRKKNE